MEQDKQGKTPIQRFCYGSNERGQGMYLNTNGEIFVQFSWPLPPLQWAIVEVASRQRTTYLTTDDRYRLVGIEEHESFDEIQLPRNEKCAVVYKVESWLNPVLTEWFGSRIRSGKVESQWWVAEYVSRLVAHLIAVEEARLGQVSKIS